MDMVPRPEVVNVSLFWKTILIATCRSWVIPRMRKSLLGTANRNAGPVHQQAIKV
jgi:hypothetical protein